MMRFTGAISAVLAGLLVVPAFTQEGASVDSLRSALDETVHALRVLTGLEREARGGAELPAEQVFALTEAPPLEPRALDERLVAERETVANLRMRVESIEAGMIAATPRDSAPASTARRPTTGLDPSLKRALGEIGVGASAPQPVVEPRTRPRQVDPVGYTADPLGQARACYRAGRYAEGLVLLETPGDDPVAWYWRGRLLERVERGTDAAAAYRKVLELAPEGVADYERERAQANLSFLEWKQKFLEQVPEAAGASRTAGGEAKGGRVR